LVFNNITGFCLNRRDFIIYLNKKYKLEKVETMTSTEEAEIFKIFSALELPELYVESILELFEKFKESLHPSAKYHNSDLLVPITIYYYFKNKEVEGKLDEGRLVESSKITENEFRVFVFQIDRFERYGVDYLASLTSEEEVRRAKDFIKYFSVCPACKKKNHEYSLISFYSSEEKWKQELKERLLSLIQKSKEYKTLLQNNIFIGIPCCECFDKYFGE